jgi:hypothetical protein
MVTARKVAVHTSKSSISPKAPGIRKWSSDHSSLIWFWRGVPARQNIDEAGNEQGNVVHTGLPA